MLNTDWIGWFVVFHNIKSLDLLCFVHSEHSEHHQRPKDDDSSDGVPGDGDGDGDHDDGGDGDGDGVPGDEGGASKCVPHQHLESSLPSSKENPTLDEEGRSKETPGSCSSMHCHGIQRVVNLEEFFIQKKSSKVTLKDNIILEKKT